MLLALACVLATALSMLCLARSFPGERAKRGKVVGCIGWPRPSLWPTMGRGAEEETGRASLAVGLGFLGIERGSVEKVGVRQVVGRKADAQVLLRHWGLCCRGGCNKGFTEEKGKRV